MTIRPAPDTMTYVTALLPVAKGVGVYAALNKTVGVMQQSSGEGTLHDSADLPRSALTPVASVVVLAAAERLLHAGGHLGDDLREVTAGVLDRIPHLGVFRAELAVAERSEPFSLRADRTIVRPSPMTDFTVPMAALRRSLVVASSPPTLR